jgi:hypothetical protein
MIAAEALANTAIGFLASWAATWLILGYARVNDSPANMQVTPIDPAGE